MLFFMGWVVTIAVLLVTADAAAPGWEKVSSKNGIETYHREVPGNPVLAIRGVAEVEGSLLHVASVLIDTNHLTEWMDRVVESRVLAVLGPLHTIEYERSSLPFPLTDRDFVVESWVEVSAVQKQIIVHVRSTQHPAVPVGNRVRGEVTSCTFTLSALDAHRTHLVIEVHSDPKGAIPKWIVNLGQKSWAFDTISGLRRQVSRVTDRDNPALQAAMHKAGLLP